LSGDRKLADESLKRLNAAEALLAKGVDRSAARFTQLVNGHRSFLKVISFQSAFSHPWCTDVEALRQGGLSAEAAEALGAWRHVTGLHSFVHLLRGVVLFGNHTFMKGAMALRSSWLACRHASDDAGDTAAMMRGVFMVLLSNMPPYMQTIFRVIGFESDRDRGLVVLGHCTSSPAHEAKTYSVIVLALHHLMLSQQEYNKDVLRHMDNAEKLITQLIEADNSIVGRLVKSHIVRRRGRIEEAVLLIDPIAAQIKQELVVYGRTDVQPYRFDFDRAMLHFVKMDYGPAAALLEPLHAENSSFNAKVLATAVSAACHAMKPEPDAERSAALLKTMGEEDDLGRMDQAIVLKKPTLMARTEPRLLGYEIFYIFGHLKCYSPTLSTSRDESINWLQARLAELDAIAAATQFNISTVATAVAGVTDPAVVAEPVEQLIAATLIAASICALKDDLDRAEQDLAQLIEACSTKPVQLALADKDPYAKPWAMYELAAVHIRRGKYLAAKSLLQTVEKRAKSAKNPFSFSHMLAYKCAGAIKVCDDSI